MEAATVTSAGQNSSSSSGPKSTGSHSGIRKSTKLANSFGNLVKTNVDDYRRSLQEIFATVPFYTPVSESVAQKSTSFCTLAFKTDLDKLQTKNHRGHQCRIYHAGEHASNAQPRDSVITVDIHTEAKLYGKKQKMNVTRFARTATFEVSLTLYKG